MASSAPANSWTGGTTRPKIRHWTYVIMQYNHYKNNFAHLLKSSEWKSWRLFLYSKSHNANHLLAKITRYQTVCLALRYHPFTHKHGIKIPHMWYCACQENAVTLHSEIRDVHQSQIDVHYFFVRGSTQEAEKYTNHRLTVTISSCEEALRKQI